MLTWNTVSGYSIHVIAKQALWDLEQVFESSSASSGTTSNPLEALSAATCLTPCKASLYTSFPIPNGQVIGSLGISQEVLS